MDARDDTGTPREDITGLLGGFRQGNAEAEARLLELTYRELRKIAAGHLRREHAVRSLQTTDLVHDAYLRIAGQAGNQWRDRAHFYQVSAHVMRQILIDRARKRNADKRGGGAPEISLDHAIDIAASQIGRPAPARRRPAQTRSRLDRRQCQVVEMRFFAGMQEDEIAAALGVSERTVNREWRMARAWLYKELYG